VKRRLTDAERDQVRAEYQRLAADGVSRTTTEHIALAFHILPPARRAPLKACYPSMQLWLGAVAKCAERAAAGKTRSASRPPRSSCSTPVSPAPINLQEAVAFLCAVVVEEVRRQLEPCLDRSLAKAVVTATLPLVPKAPKDADLTKPETLDDKTLRLELIKARATDNLIRWHQLVRVAKKRSEAANTVEFHSGDAQ